MTLRRGMIAKKQLPLNTAGVATGHAAAGNDAAAVVVAGPLVASVFVWLVSWTWCC